MTMMRARQSGPSANGLLFTMCLLAFSAGIASQGVTVTVDDPRPLAAAVAHDVLGNRAMAVIACSESYPKKELELARSLALERGWRFREIRTSELENPEYAKNAANRCYFCKAELFTKLDRMAREGGFAAIAYGENADDMRQVRPGRQAAGQTRGWPGGASG